VDTGSGDAAGAAVPCPRHPAITARKITMTMAATHSGNVYPDLMGISRILFNNNYSKCFGSESG
jgi:hypothetical protein